MRNAKTGVILAVALCTLGCSVEVATTTTSRSTVPAQGDGPDVGVERVIDGDSLELLIGGELVEARLKGVNAPELFNAANKTDCNGQKAKDALSNFLADGRVMAEGDELDRFGRLLVEVSVDGVLVADVLTSQGWLLVTDQNQKRRRALRAAADQELGIFGSSCGEPTRTLMISDVQANPSGNDRSNLDNEWVELFNDSDLTVNLGDWILRDETTSHIFVLDSLPLAPRDKVKIRTGAGNGEDADRSDGDNDVYLGESFPVWSNGDETVLLIDPQGVVAQVMFLIGVGE